MATPEGIRVLHVDDEPGFTALTTDMLERNDARFTVDTAPGASEGLDRLADHEFDCVVSDYDMPGMDGIEFLRRVREAYPDLPFILFTGKGSEEIAGDAISAGVTHYVRKRSGTEQYELLANRIENAVEQYRSRRRLDRQREEYQQLFEQAPVMFAVFQDEDGEPIVTNCNERFAEQLGYDIERVRGMSVRELYTEESAAEAVTGDGFQRALAGDFTTEERTLRTKSGDAKDVLVRAVPRTDATGAVTGTLALYIDVTERKQREQELERYATIVKVSGDPVYTLDADGRFTFVNDALVELTGYEEGALLGEHVSSILVREDAERGGMVMRSLGDPDTDRRTTELTIARADGEQVPCEIHVTSLPYEDDFRGTVGVIRDISRRKERERELKRKQRETERYRELLERALGAADTYVWEWDLDTDEVTRHPTVEPLFGLSSDALGDVTDFVERIHPDDRDRVEEAMRTGVVSGEGYDLEYRARTEDGSWRWIRDRGDVITDGAGDPVRAVGSISDVTERKERERDLERERERLDTVVSNIPVVVFALDPDGVFTVSRGKGLDALGLEPGEVVGESVFDVYAGHDDVLDDVERALAGEQVTATQEVGDLVFETTYEPVFDGDGTVRTVIGVSVDVTEQTERERELEATERRLDAILEHTTTPMFMKDDEGRYLFVNRAYGKGYDVEGEIAGKTAHDVHPPERADRIEQLDRSVLESGEPIEFESQETIEGEERTFLTTVVPIYDTGERRDPEDPVALFGVASDITAHKRRERELERERDRLDEFASVVSHDLRSPLNVATARLELADEECDSAHLDDAADALDRMDTLIDELLTLARDGEGVGETRPVALGSAVEDCWRTVETATASLVNATEQTIEADPSRVRELLENLVRNAVEHGGDGVTVTIGDLDDGFYVADDGPGIPQDERDRMFEPGYSTADDGTGFGLAIVKEIAEAHGWEVRGTDSDDGGARFEITGVDTGT